MGLHLRHFRGKMLAVLLTGLMVGPSLRLAVI
jgi:hypothetical protein